MLAKWAKISLPESTGARYTSKTMGASSQGTSKQVITPSTKDIQGSMETMLSAIQLDDVILVYDPELVYEPSDDTFLFLDTLSREKFRDSLLLDMGSGTGILGIYFGKHAKKVTFIDLNPHAVAFTWLNCWLNDLKNYDVRLGILFKPLKKNEVFDYVLFNAPYLIEDIENPEDLLEYSWSGVNTIKLFLKQFSFYVKKAAYLTLNNYSFELLRNELENFDYRILAKKKFFFEEILLLEIKSNWNGPK